MGRRIRTKSDGRIKLRKEIDLVGAVLIIIGGQIGSGIFISPKGVLEYSQSPGASMIVWLFGGILATMGAFCYTELATLIPKSGAEYAILLDGWKFSEIPAFIFAFTATTVIQPAGLAIMAITTAKYTLSLGYGKSSAYTGFARLKSRRL